MYRKCIKRLKNTHYKILKELFLSSFYFENLPGNVPNGYVERTLFDENKIIFYKDKKVDELLILKQSGERTKNIYGVSENIDLISENSTTIVDVKKDEYVRVTLGNNTICYNELVEYYAEKLANIDYIIDNNLYFQKHKFAILSTQDSGINPTLLKRLFESDEPILLLDKSYKDVANFEKLDINTVFNGRELQELKNSIENEFLENIGVVNNGNEKRERLIADEVKTENSKANTIHFKIINNLRKDIEKVNKKFNVNIQVKSYLDYLEFEDSKDSEDENIDVNFDGGVLEDE